MINRICHCKVKAKNINLVCDYLIQREKSQCSGILEHPWGESSLLYLLEWMDG